MKKILIGLAVIIVVVLAVVALGAKKATAPDHMTAPSTASQNSTPQSGNAVTISNYTFTPKNLTVKKGTTVTWTNQDVARHTITVDSSAPSGGPSGPLFGKGETYKFTFDAVGTYNYHCEPHPYMHGTVTVTQ